MTAITDCVLLCIEDEAIRRISQSNGQFLRSLNTEMGLSQDKIIKSKWNIRKEKDESAKETRKKRKSGVFQTFFTDLFPNPLPRNRNHKDYENAYNHPHWLLSLTSIPVLSEENDSADPDSLPIDMRMVSERLRLSYVDQDRCIKLLNLYGVRVGDSDQPVDPELLPVVVRTPVTTFHEVIPDHEKVFPHTETDPINELLLFFDPQKPETAGSIRRIITEQIDLPARKIMIEAMVLEISSQALDQLGVEWDFNSGKKGFPGNFINRKLDGSNDSLVVGKIVSPAVGTPQFDATITNDFRIQPSSPSVGGEGSAQILSRPSVLTLDNRMAYINAPKRFPSPTPSSSRLCKRLIFGTLPQVSNSPYARGSAATDQRFPCKSMRRSRRGFRERIKAAMGKDDVILATAPTLSIRKSKPMPELPMTLPFIVGGLIAKDSEETLRKVPLLGDLPLLGGLFRSKDENGIEAGSSHRDHSIGSSRRISGSCKHAQG